MGDFTHKGPPTYGVDVIVGFVGFPMGADVDDGNEMLFICQDCVNKESAELVKYDTFETFCLSEALTYNDEGRPAVCEICKCNAAKTLSNRVKFYKEKQNDAEA